MVAGVPTVLLAQEAKPAVGGEQIPAGEKKDGGPSPATPRSEAVALKEFKADMAALKAWVQAEKAKTAVNPMAMVKMLGEIDTKFLKVRTDGLPDDLAGEYTKMSEAMKKISAVFKGGPADEAELVNWMLAKTKAPGFNEKMEALEKEAKETGSKLKETGKKYGITELDFDAKEKDPGVPDEGKGDKKPKAPAKGNG
jgi:hypothetical protein